MRTLELHYPVIQVLNEQKMPHENNQWLRGNAGNNFSIIVTPYWYHLYLNIGT